MNKTIHLLALILVFSSFVGAQNYKAITDVHIIRTDKEKIISNTNLLIKDNKIEKIGKNIVIPEQAEIIDGSGKYLIPGLVDAHIHFFQSGGLYTRPDGLDLTHRKSYEDEMAWIKANIDDVFKRYIRCGITSVIDMGGPMWNFDVKKYSKEAPVAPRVYLSGPLIASYQPDVLTTDDPPIIKVNTVEEALKLVDKQIAMNTDFIKIWYVITAGMTGEVFEPIVKAIIEESHKRGKPVYVHALELDKSAKRAMRAGADVLVHSIRDQAIDEDFLKLAKQNNVSYIPTLWVLESYASVYSKQLDLLPIEHQAGNPYIIGSLYDMHEIPADELPERVNKMHHDHTPIKTSDIILQNLKKVQEAGINVVAGTDAGNVGVIHGPSIFHEFMLMSKAGLSNWEILVDATLNAAKMLKNEDLFGSVKAGKLADLVILNSNPLEDIQNTSDIALVIKDGQLFYPEKVISPSPEEIVQIQLNAYNEKDLEAFLYVFDENIEVYNFPDELRYKGKEEMRKLYASFFEKAGELHCQLINRITYGPYVMDREHVTTSIPGREIIEGQAIYEVADGKIIKLWFLRK